MALFCHEMYQLVIYKNVYSLHIGGTLRRMHVWRHMVLCFRSIHWILIVAVFALAVFPVHLHYHHVSESHPVVQDSHHELAPAHVDENHGHETDLHVVASVSADEDHATVHTFKVSPDGLARKLNDDSGSILLFLLVLFLLPVFTRQTSASPLARVAFIFTSPNRLSPPLRAPPQN
jgi:hypothetical protein